ncbi:hypothetical protein CKA32_002861 [Geitlerinema sp. FC II]|nr:hypothetical protein CKA32_002861 [Geitlerinema sp. FC II]
MTQVKIVQQIQAQKADYVLALKKNYPTFYTQIEEKFKFLRTFSNYSSEVSYEQRLRKDIIVLKNDEFGRFPFPNSPIFIIKNNGADFKPLSWSNEFVIFGIKRLGKSSFICLLFLLMLLF